MNFATDHADRFFRHPARNALPSADVAELPGRSAVPVAWTWDIRDTRCPSRQNLCVALPLTLKLPAGTRGTFCNAACSLPAMLPAFCFVTHCLGHSDLSFRLVSLVPVLPAKFVEVAGIEPASYISVVHIRITSFAPCGASGRTCVRLHQVRKLVRTKPLRCLLSTCGIA